MLYYCCLGVVEGVWLGWVGLLVGVLLGLLDSWVEVSIVYVVYIGDYFYGMYLVVVGFVEMEEYNVVVLVVVYLIGGGSV